MYGFGTATTGPAPASQPETLEATGDEEVIALLEEWPRSQGSMQRLRDRLRDRGYEIRVRVGGPADPAVRKAKAAAEKAAKGVKP